jgi:hypothetical protein
VIGRRQPTLAERLVNPRTRWRRLKVTGWYGRSERLVEIVSGTAVWHHPGRMVPIRYVLARDVAGELRPQAFLCTELDAQPVDILRWFVRRWSTEVTFAEVRRHLGVETSGNGQIQQSLEPRPSCSGCSPWSPCGLMSCMRLPRPYRVMRAGIESLCRRSAMQLPWSAGKYGRAMIFTRLRSRQTSLKYPVPQLTP